MFTVAVDVDDTLLDWSNSFQSWMENFNFLDPVCDLLDFDGNIESWLYQSDPSIDCLQSLYFVMDFNESDMFSDLPILEGAVEALEQLNRRGASVILHTACGTKPTSRFARNRNLQKRNLSHYPIQFFELGEDKSGLMPYLPKGSFFIDDSLKNCQVAEEHGMEVIHFKRQKFAKSDFTTISSWKDFKEVSPCLI